MRLSLVLALGLLIAAPTLAQGRDTPGDEQAGSGFALDTAVPFSAEAQGVMGAGLFGPTADPIRAIENPAFLAGLDGVRVAGAHTIGLNGIEGLDLRTGALAAGTERALAGRPLRVGVGLALADITSSDALSESSNRVLGLGVGAGWDGPVRVRTGVGVRRLSASASSSNSGGPEVSISQTALAADLGADVTCPVGAWLQPGWEEGPRVVLDVTAGGALRGLTLTADLDVAPDSEAPLPAPVVDRSPAVGGRALLGVGVGTRARPLLAAAVEGLADNVEFSDDTVRLRGARVTLLETFTVRAGSFEGDSFLPRTSAGLGLSVGGLLRAIGVFAGDPGLYDLGARFDVRLDVADQTFEDNAFGIFDDARTAGVVVRYRP